MPLNSRSRLQSVQLPEPPVECQPTTGKRAGQVVSGMASFYGNVMKGAVNKLKSRGSQQETGGFIE